jgi:hypothetical protein
MATFEGVQVTMDMIPVEVKAPVTVDVANFAIRLKSGGTLELVDSEWIVGPVDYTKNTLSFAALDRISLKNSRIVLNGNTLALFANRIEVDKASIISFADVNRKAKRGADASEPGRHGEPGTPGDTGGVVAIHAIEGFFGTLDVDLSGQEGGDGGHGAQGSKGRTGDPGRDSQSGVCLGFFGPYPCCKVDATQGGRGYTGEAGGSGGDGGAGGHGGTLQLYNVGTSPLPAASVRFTAIPGDGGAAGTGAAGGEGGDGGEGGRGGFSCNGANRGPKGDNGATGVLGAKGLAGAPGRSLIKNLDLQVVISSAASTSETMHPDALWVGSVVTEQSGALST